MSTSTAGHPLFARIYAHLSGRMERELGRYREELVGDLPGRVLEIGAGDGMNFAHYGPATDEVVAVEPEPYLREKATPRAEAAVPSISVVEGTAEALPFEDDSFDVVVVCLVLCTISDLESALDEVRRVLKPGGSLRFFEHVRSDDPNKARIQTGLDRSGVWPRLSGGCHCSCETVSGIERSGFEVSEIRDFETRPNWLHTSPSVLGTAVIP
jgi:ubiquinone/menaquinone biosynthesis C-methylase UbiE